MGALDKVFGIILIMAGFTIFSLYSLFIIVPREDLKNLLQPYMGGCPYAADAIIPDKSWLFKFPAICLAVGVFGIWAFIKRTVAKIAAKK